MRLAQPFLFISLKSYIILLKTLQTHRSRWACRALIVFLLSAASWHASVLMRLHYTQKQKDRSLQYCEIIPPSNAYIGTFGELPIRKCLNHSLPSQCVFLELACSVKCEKHLQSGRRNSVKEGKW